MRIGIRKYSLISGINFVSCQVLEIKGEYLRFKTFGTAKSGNSDWSGSCI